jgi:hypothetical protein
MGDCIFEKPAYDRDKQQRRRASVSMSSVENQRQRRKRPSGMLRTAINATTHSRELAPWPVGSVVE